MKIKPYARIVIEGMDGSGKTTLVKELTDFLGDNGDFVPGYNRQPEPKSEMDQWWMEQLARHPVGKVVVHDRFFYPELIYGPILRGYVKGSSSTLNYVREFLRAYALLIYCRPPTEVLKKGVEVEFQMEGVKNMFNDLLIAYDKLMIEEAPSYNGRFLIYDWSKKNAFNNLAQVVSGYMYE